MEMTGQTKWSVIRSLLDGRYKRDEKSVRGWMESGKPIKRLTNHNLPFESLGVNESFDIPTGVNLQYVRNRASANGKRLGRRFTVTSADRKVKRIE